MKIVVLGGSPNKKGSTHILADCFRQGAEEAGHAVEMIDIAHADIHPASAASTAAMKAPACRRTMWRSYAKRFWMRICWYLPAPFTIMACLPS